MWGGGGEVVVAVGCGWDGWWWEVGGKVGCGDVVVVGGWCVGEYGVGRWLCVGVSGVCV